MQRVAGAFLPVRLKPAYCTYCRLHPSTAFHGQSPSNLQAFCVFRAEKRDEFSFYGCCECRRQIVCRDGNGEISLPDYCRRSNIPCGRVVSDFRKNAEFSGLSSYRPVGFPVVGCCYHHECFSEDRRAGYFRERWLIIPAVPKFLQFKGQGRRDNRQLCPCRKDVADFPSRQLCRRRLR